MARNENPPFPRGGVGTYYSDPGTTSTTDGTQLEGMEWVFEDKDFSTGNERVALDRTNRFVTCRAVRNKSGGALLPKRAVAFKVNGSTPGVYGGQVSGYLATVGNAGCVVDEFLPAAGAANEDIFWGVVQGPSKMTTDTAGDTTISVGSFVVPGGTGDGTVVDQDKDGDAGDAAAITVAFNQIQGALGRAMEATTTTATDFMVDVRRM